MADELYSVLTKFHREVVVPDKRFDRLESEYHALSAAVKRIEERLDRTALRAA